MRRVFIYLLLLSVFIGCKKRELPVIEDNHIPEVYFVSPTGDDNNDGLSEETAWRTISFAASQYSPVGEGDTVYIKAGVYKDEDIFFEKNYSPESKPIVFIGYRDKPGDITSFDFSYGDDVDASKMPLITQSSRKKGEGINISDSYNITIKNLQIANSLSGINIWNSEPINSNITLENIYLKDIGWEYSTAIAVKYGNGTVIKNCLIVNATGAGMDLWGDNMLVENCKVYSDESEPVSDGTYTSMDYYIVIKGNNNVVRNCYAERVGDLEDVGHGFEIKEYGENNLFENCTVKNMIAGCFSVRWSGVKNNEFRHCTALGGVSNDVSAFMIRDGASNNTFNSCVSDGCEAGVRFILTGEDADYCGEYNTFVNCIIKNAKWVVDLNAYEYNSAPADNNILINCDIINADYLFNADRPNHGNSFVNCIITGVNNFLQGDYTPGFTYSYCDFYNNGFATPAGTGNITANPLFVNAGAGDFHLTSTSPCIDAGAEDGAPDVDFDGTPRPQGAGVDIGAYEYKSQKFY